MTVARYVLGVLLLGVALVPLQGASYRWRARLLGEWSGAPARLAEILADLAVMAVVFEVLGAVHLFRRWPVVITLAAVGLVGIWAERRTGRHRPGAGTSLVRQVHAMPRAANIVALVAVAVVVAEWSTQTVFSYHYGMVGTDTLWYHMPFAARFAQTGAIAPLHYVDSEPVTVFFPATSELFHGFGILLMGNDVLSPILNMLWLGLALLAAWCIGRPFLVAPVTLTGCAILLATPGLVGTQPGGAYDDVVGLALLLSTVAFFVNGQGLEDRPQRAAWALAALSMGLALGTKFTFIGPAAALTIGVIFLAPRVKRLQWLGWWLGFLVLTGIFWYGRNIVAVGNPLPTLHLKLGPVSLPSPPVATPTSTVAHFLFNASAWRNFYLPGLRSSFGPAWWALLGLSAAGLVLAVVRGDRLQRVLGAVGLASAVIFVLTPQFLVADGVPAFFQENVRYADAAIILGLVLLPINPLLVSWSRARWVLGAYMAVLAATQFDASIWPTSFFSERFSPPVRGTDSWLGLLIGVGVLLVGLAVILGEKRSTDRRLWVYGWIPLIAVVLIVGLPVQQSYLRNRYQSDQLFMQQIAASLPSGGARIAISGPLSFLQYPEYGRTLTNYVQFLGRTGPAGAYLPFRSCNQWRQQVVGGRYDFVALTTGAEPTRAATFTADPPLMTWTSGQGARVLRHGTFRFGTSWVGWGVYQIGPHYSVSGCAKST